MTQPDHQVTQLLAGIAAGETQASDRLLAVVYDDLRRMASRQLRGERVGITIQTTDLVHDAYLRLLGGDNEVRAEDRRHFFGAAARAMSRILIEQARRKKRLKHGGGRQRADLDVSVVEGDGPDAETLIALDQALEDFEARNARAVEVFRFRYFVGMTIEQVAETLDISHATVERDWTLARTRLAQHMLGAKGESAAEA